MRIPAGDRLSADPTVPAHRQLVRHPQAARRISAEHRIVDRHVHIGGVLVDLAGVEPASHPYKGCALTVELQVRSFRPPSARPMGTAGACSVCRIVIRVEGEKPHPISLAIGEHSEFPADSESGESLSPRGPFLEMHPSHRNPPSR